MGSETSKMSSSTSYPNLDLRLVDEAKKRFSSCSGKAGEMNKKDFLTWQSSLGDLAVSFFDGIAAGGALKMQRYLEVSNALNGDADDAAPVLLTIHGTSAQMLAAVANAFAKNHSATDGDALLRHLMKDAPKDDSRLTNYLVSNPTATALLRSVYSPLWGGDGCELLPKLAGLTALLTSDCALAVINSYLPMERRKLWTLLFSSLQHGSSFSQLQKRISGEGPALVVIKTNEDRVFGCFASDGFLSGPQYRGDATSFLFTIFPEIDVFSATGNTSQYAYLNIQQETLPNGLGIGGSADVWPLFIHEEYGSGISCRNLSAFEKCHLAGEQNFQIKDMEVWRVGIKRRLTIEEGERIRSTKSVIDKDPEAKALLEMSGRAMHSEAYREPEPMLDEE